MHRGRFRGDESVLGTEEEQDVSERAGVGRANCGREEGARGVGVEARSREAL